MIPSIETDQNMINHLQEVFDDVVKRFNNPELKELVLNETFIAGGAIRSLYTKTPVNDYDFFFRTKESAMKFVQLVTKGLKGDLPGSPLAQAVGNDQGFTTEELRVTRYKYENFDTILKAANMDEVLAVTENALTFKMNRADGEKSLTIQFIIKYSGVPSRLIEKFDFTNSMAFFDPKETSKSKLSYQWSFIESIKQKKLVYNSRAFEPIHTLARIDKFTKEGYHIRWADLQKLMIGIMKTKTIKDVQKYKAKGMY